LPGDCLDDGDDVDHEEGWDPTSAAEEVGGEKQVEDDPRDKKVLGFYKHNNQQGQEEATERQ